MMTTSATVNAKAVQPVHTMTKARPMMWQVATAVKIIPSIPLRPRCKNLGFFYFPFKKHLTSAPGCGIIIVGRAGPGRRPGTEFPIGTPICDFFGGKCDPSICVQFPVKPGRRSVLVFPIGSHIVRLTSHASNPYASPAYVNATKIASRADEIARNFS